MISKIEILQVREAIKFSKLKTAIRILTRHKLCVFECTLLKQVRKFNSFIRNNHLQKSAEELDKESIIREYALMQILRKLQMLRLSSDRRKSLQLYLDETVRLESYEDAALYAGKLKYLIDYLLQQENIVESTVRKPALYSMRKHEIAFAYPIVTIKRLLKLEAINNAQYGLTSVTEYRENRIDAARLYEELCDKP